MFSQNAQNHADNCRFCWMCRHVCPIGQKTGNESNTPRAKGLLVSLCQRGQEFEETIAQTMYECALCGACSNDCVTGFEPPVYIREARTEAAVKGLTPGYVQSVIHNIEKTGNLYGKTRESIDPGLSAQLDSLPEKGDLALLVTETALYQTPMIVLSAIKILKKAGLSFTVVFDAPSGVHLGDLIGYVDEVRTIAAACIQRLDQTEASRIAVLDPSDAVFLTQVCPSWGIIPKGSIITWTSFLASLVSENLLEFQWEPQNLPVVTVHDPCRLARDFDETEPIRAIIRSMGFSVKEMFLNGKFTKCCGGETLNAYSPQLAALTATGRLEDALRTGASVLITACPGCYLNFSKNLPEQMTLWDLTILLAQACNL